MRKIVLLPEPEGPTSTTNSWSLTVRLISCTTSTLPKYLLMCSKRTLAIAHHSFSRSSQSRYRNGYAFNQASYSFQLLPHYLPFQCLAIPMSQFPSSFVGAFNKTHELLFEL